MVKVLAFGTFDLLHQGHIFFLRQAARLGTLHTVVARDVNVRRIKGSKPVNKEAARLAAIQRLSCVHEALLGNRKNMMKIVASLKPDVICLGYDQDGLGLRTFLKSRHMNTKVVRVKAFKPSRFKSSKLRKVFLSNP